MTLTSQRYDRSAVIWPQNQMAARPNPQKPYDASSAKTMTPKKFVTDESELFVDVIALINTITMRTLSRGATGDAYSAAGVVSVISYTICHL